MERKWEKRGKMRRKTGIVEEAKGEGGLRQRQKKKDIFTLKIREPYGERSRGSSGWRDRWTEIQRVCPPPSL